MFLCRQILNSRIRTIISQLQYKVISVQNLHNEIFHIQHSNFLLAKRLLSETNNEIEKNDKNKEVEKQKLAQIKPKLQVVFLCKKCNTRNSKIMSKHAYEKGVVIIRCDGCKNNHLIADNLGWFGDTNCRNIEQILKRKGENVRRIRNDTEGYFEAVRDDSVDEDQDILKLIEEGKEYVNKEHEKVGHSKNKQ